MTGRSFGTCNVDPLYEFKPVLPLGGDKVNMLTHTYPHEALKIKVTTCNHQADIPLYATVWSDLVICKFRKSMVIHNIECPETRCH